MREAETVLAAPMTRTAHYDQRFKGHDFARDYALERCAARQKRSIVQVIGQWLSRLFNPKAE